MATINDTDLLLVNRGGVDYKVTALKLKENFKTEPPLPPRPWDGHEGGIWHIKNVEHSVISSSIPITDHILHGMLMVLIKEK